MSIIPTNSGLLQGLNLSKYGFISEEVIKSEIITAKTLITISFKNIFFSFV